MRTEKLKNTSMLSSLVIFNNKRLVIVIVKDRKILFQKISKTGITFSLRKCKRGVMTVILSMLGVAFITHTEEPMKCG